MTEGDINHIWIISWNIIWLDSWGCIGVLAYIFGLGLVTPQCQIDLNEMDK